VLSDRRTLPYGSVVNLMMVPGGRLLGLIAVAITVAVIALLVAGYGVAVGVGAFAGLIIGMVVGLVSTIWFSRGSGRSIAFGSGEWSSGAPPPEAIREMQEMAEVIGVDLGPIRSVRPIVATVASGGLTLQLASLEHHEGGLVMVLEARPSAGVAAPIGMARVKVTDDIGTVYRASAQSQGGSPGQARFEIVAIPVAPAAATRLGVTVERFVDPFGGRDRYPSGPWTFDVSLA
jgi:hypothetical protein